MLKWTLRCLGCENRPGQLAPQCAHERQRDGYGNKEECNIESNVTRVGLRVSIAGYALAVVKQLMFFIQTLNTLPDMKLPVVQQRGRCRVNVTNYPCYIILGFEDFVQKYRERIMRKS
jgi:hypothetical protein